MMKRKRKRERKTKPETHAKSSFFRGRHLFCFFVALWVVVCVDARRARFSWVIYSMSGRTAVSKILLVTMYGSMLEEGLRSSK